MQGSGERGGIGQRARQLGGFRASEIALDQSIRGWAAKKSHITSVAITSLAS